MPKTTLNHFNLLTTSYKNTETNIVEKVRIINLTIGAIDNGYIREARKFCTGRWKIYTGNTAGVI